MNNVLDIAAKVQMAAQMYDARAAVIGVMGRDKFLKRVEDFRPIFELVCFSKKVNQLQATTLLMKDAVDDAHARLIVLAMCVEIIEPSPAPPIVEQEGR